MAIPNKIPNFIRTRLMTSKIVAGMLASAFDSMFVNFNRKDFELSLVHGVVELAGLEMRLEFVNDLLLTVFPALGQLSLKITRTYVSRVRLSFSIMHARTQPMKIAIDDVIVIIEEPELQQQQSEADEAQAAGEVSSSVLLTNSPRAYIRTPTISHHRRASKKNRCDLIPRPQLRKAMRRRPSRRSERAYSSAL